MCRKQPAGEGEGLWSCLRQVLIYKEEVQSFHLWKQFTGKVNHYIFELIGPSIEEEWAKSVTDEKQECDKGQKGIQGQYMNKGKLLSREGQRIMMRSSQSTNIALQLPNDIEYQQLQGTITLEGYNSCILLREKLAILWEDNLQMISSSPNQPQYSHINVHALVLFSTWIYNYDLQQMNSKENNQDKLIKFLEKECEQQRQLEQYYERQLSELIHGVAPPQQSLILSKPSPPRTKNVRVKTQEVSIMEESIFSINSQAISRTDKKQTKREAASFEMQCQLLSKEIAKLIEGISNKDAVFKKTAAIPKRNSSFTNKSIIKPSTSGIKMNLSTVSISKTERQSSNHQRQQLLSELGDSTLMTSSDEVVSKLVGNLRLEEQRFVDALLYRSRMSARSKMRNYLQHLCEKNEETLFKLRQKAIDRSLSRIETNRETVRNGYTKSMKELIEAGLRGKASA